MREPTLLGQRIRFFRERAHVSQFDLENDLNISHGVISRIEQGKTNPSKETINSISQALNLNFKEINYLIGNTAEPVSAKDIKIAINDIQDYFKQRGVFAYLLDDRWRFLEISNSFSQIFGFDKKEIELVKKRTTGQTMLSIILSDTLGINKFLETENFNKIVEDQVVSYFNEVGFIHDKSFFSTKELIDKNEVARRKWEECESKPQSPFTRHDMSEISFKLHGMTISMNYSRQPLYRNPRLEIIEYKPTNQVYKFLTKFI